MSDNDGRDDEDVGIDHDRTEGSLKQAGGKLKEGAGKLFGDSKMETEGQADQGEGSSRILGAESRTKLAT